LTGAALALILPSALAHAGWNLLAKSSGGGLPFLYLAGLATLPMLVPAAVIAAAVDGTGGIDATAAGWMVGAAVLHFSYLLTLQSGYRAADLSVVYPLARGTGPLLAFVAAVLVLGESPHLLRVAGAAVIVGAVLALGLAAARHSRTNHAGIAWALVTGVLISAYTLWDRHGVDDLGIQPIVYLCGINICMSVLFLPLVLRRRAEVSHELRTNRRNIVGFGLMAPLSYVLFLFALTLAPVTFVAPLRELSILFAVVLGGQFLAEGHTWNRALAAVVMVAGVAAISAG
jgi:drug/metabolite transporter (DMT)-like permease